MEKEKKMPSFTGSLENWPRGKSRNTFLVMYAELGELWGKFLSLESQL